MIELTGYRIAIRHILYAGGKMTEEGRTYLEREQPDVCIFGHTHQPKTEWFDKTLLFNPGSAGPKRFKLPRGSGMVKIEDRMTTQHIRLRARLEEFFLLRRVLRKSWFSRALSDEAAGLSFIGA